MSIVHVVSMSGGKDSTATVPLDIVYQNGAVQPLLFGAE